MIPSAAVALLPPAALNARMDIHTQRPRVPACLFVMCRTANSAISHRRAQDARVGTR